ncbi:hypothetical protein [Zhihengliuella halotolerans]|uniref:Uncharacterized protein n=1 Tax=Zhihengliuella halotolerans TaxID=370736 RepID=A0A4Q8AD27_9MICC|nr:hypothetical protein [Zhihengliuella halotolerans]RZU61545.1 hypothetical protein EV380_1116 [Zhihengliuella halotolerans]
MKEQTDAIHALLETQSNLIAELQASYERERQLLVELEHKRRILPDIDVAAAKRKAKTAAANPRRTARMAVRRARRVAGKVKRSLVSKYGK